MYYTGGFTGPIEGVILEGIRMLAVKVRMGGKESVVYIDLINKLRGAIGKDQIVLLHS